MLTTQAIQTAYVADQQRRPPTNVNVVFVLAGNWS
jgi:hypothetical protein